MKSREFKVGDRVTGAIGRDSHGWSGTIKEIGAYQTGVQYFAVHWKEREKSAIGAIARTPTLNMLAEQIQFDSSSIS